MPVADRDEDESFQDFEKERDHEPEKDREKGSKSKSSKTKDLSHVPCKFFKVGSCTAGSSCPFSHAAQEPGQQKDVCTWFVKGNCKFGHKCALAHILPGQSMAMDRKNKKAAQLAASSGNTVTGGSQGREKSSRTQRKDIHSGLGGSTRNTLLSGSTAPTRVLPASSRPPITMPLKATISPSAPAPPLKDTDFTSLGFPDDNNKLAASLSRDKPQSPTISEPSATPRHPDEALAQETPSKAPPSPLPVSTPSTSNRLGTVAGRTPGSVGFGPIGSPPRSSPSHTNGFSPGASPHSSGLVSTSPFSAPGTQSVFLSFEKDNSGSDFKTRSGLAASLGSTRTWTTELGLIPSQVTNRSNPGPLSMSRNVGEDFAVEEEDLEEFLPSSLTDLLTPEERSRRMSRTNSSQPMAARGAFISHDTSIVEPRPHPDVSHRYSRSVPAPSLLGDIKSIWTDSSSGFLGSANTGASSRMQSGGVASSGITGSFKSNVDFGGRSFGEEALSPSFLSPSNASAAFLPGLHHHYLSSKAAAGQRPSTNVHQGLSNNLHPAALSMTGTPNTNQGNFGNVAPSDVTFLPSRLKPSGRPFDPLQDLSSALQFAGRPIHGGSNTYGSEAEEYRSSLSPLTRALEAHAPGQSLPQGLAAGYSRIHALPPPPSIPSPSATSVLAPSQPGSLLTNANGLDWVGNTAVEHSPSSAATGLETMISRLSYSAATSRGTSGLSTAAPAPASNGRASQLPPTASPSTMARSTSGRNWGLLSPLSPLSGPVMTGDDDDLFSMDG